MMKGVYFDGIHSYDDLGLILSSVEIEPPQIKTKKIDIPGANGSIDLTQFDGKIHYYDRTLTFVFTARGIAKSWASVFSEVTSRLHGREMDIVLDDDPFYTWHGRVSVKSYKRGKSNGTIEIEVDASPYKYSRFATDQEVEWDTFDFTNGILQCLKNIVVDGTTEVKAVGYAENTVPVISVTGTVSVTYDGITTALPEGKNKILSITIREGENTLIFTGKGTVTIEYRGGSL